MSILGEVSVTHLKCVQRFTQDMGATDVIDVQCRIAGNAGGKVNIRASLHIRTATFDDEKWKIITFMCSLFRQATEWRFLCPCVSFFFARRPIGPCNLVLFVHHRLMRGEKPVHDSRIGAEPFLHCET